MNDGLKELLNKAKTTGQIASEMGRKFQRYDSTPAREFQAVRWLSEGDVVEFFKDKVVVDRKQIMDDLEGLIQELENESWRPCPEANIKYIDIDEVKSLLRQFFGEAFSVKGFKGSVEAQK